MPYDEKGEREERSPTTGRAIEIDPNYVLAYFNRAVALRGAVPPSAPSRTSIMRSGSTLARAGLQRARACVV
jgi:hypothetical protein